MKTKFRLLLWLLSLAAYLCAGAAKEVPVAVQASMIVRTAEKYHYAPRPVNDSFSLTVYKSFLNMLDPHGTFFTEESIAKLDNFKFALDDQIQQQKTAFLDNATSLYGRQLHGADSLVREFKNREIDLTVNDTLWLGGDPVYGKQNLLKKTWEKWIKYMMLLSYQATGDSTKTAAPTTPGEMRKLLDDVIARETCRIHGKMNPPGGIREFTGLCYLKAISNAFDPHTEYLSFAEKNQFETSLSKESGAFGIRLNVNIPGEIEIAEVLPGGPAWNSNNINEGDVILDIKTSDNKTIDLRCTALSDVHGFLSSIADQKTAFTIRKKSGTIVTVSLKKEILDVERNTIRSYVLKGNTSIGYIYLPSFYVDFTYENYSSKGCANDLAKELIKLKNVPVDGLILDVRSNGGGSLEEASRLAGEFIDYGALCITHSRGKNPETIKDNARGTIYDGPLVVLTNSSSASASEFLVGVLQDYNRALIVGSTTFGKSTMQEVLPVNAGDFDSLSHYKGEPPGFITLTTGSFYRVTGATHQKVGVTPDIELPELFENMQDREGSYDGALQFGKINKKTYYYPASPLPAGKLKNLCSARVKGNAGFARIIKTAALFSKTNSRLPVPLSLHVFADYIKRFDKQEDSLTAKKCPFSAALPEYVESSSTMSDREKADNEIVTGNIRGDIYINEAFNIINDLVGMSIKKEGK